MGGPTSTPESQRLPGRLKRMEGCQKAVRGLGYGPGRLGFHFENFPDAEIDIKSLPFDAYDQRDRAVRAVDRFRSFVNGPASASNVRILVDEFLEAAETVWHLKDHIEHDVNELAAAPGYEELGKKARSEMDAVVNAPDMQALRMLANASKHGKLRRPDGYDGTVKIRFEAKVASVRFDGTLADVYRRMQLELPDGIKVHPTDFLEERLRKWSMLLSTHLDKNLGRKLAERMSGQAARPA
jgi:hypothetical protein